MVQCLKRHNGEEEVASEDPSRRNNQIPGGKDRLEGQLAQLYDSHDPCQDEHVEGRPFDHVQGGDNDENEDDGLRDYELAVGLEGVEASVSRI